MVNSSFFQEFEIFESLFTFFEYFPFEVIVLLTTQSIYIRMRGKSTINEVIYDMSTLLKSHR